MKRKNCIVSIGFVAILVLFMVIAGMVISAENESAPSQKSDSGAAGPKPDNLSGTPSGPPPEQSGGGSRGRSSSTSEGDPNQSRGGRRGGNIDMSSMTPEQRQQMAERGGRFMRGGGGQGGDMSGFNGPDASGDPNGLQSLNLNNVEMRNIVKMIGDWTGKAVIPANDDIMQIRLTIYAPQKMTKTEALGLILMALQSRGIVADQTQGRIILRPLATAKLGAIPTLGTDEPLAKFQDRTAVVEKWFQLQYYNPTNLVDMIKPLVGEHGYVMADQKTGRLAVIDTVDNLSRIEKIVQELDIPESEQSVEQVFEIKYADPTEMVNVLQLILGGAAGSSGQSSGQGGRGERSGDQSGRSSGSTQTKTATSVSISATTTPIRMIPVPKQKWIIVRAGREDMKNIAEWIQKLDMAGMTKPQQSVVPIIYADVTEVVNIVRNTLKETPNSEMKANVVVEGLVTSRQVVIFGNEEARVMVEKMIAQLDMPKGNFFIERTFKLKHADPDQIKKNIDGLYSAQQTSSRNWWENSRNNQADPKNEVKAISYPTMKQVTVIASEQNMVKIIKQIEQEWDVQLDIQKDQYRILTLSNSDPVKMTVLLDTLFSEDQQSGSQSFFRMLFGEETAGKQKIVGSLYGMLTFEPVPDTKKLIVISKIPEAYDVIEKLVNELDGQEGGEVPSVVTLKYADCESLCDQLNSIFNEAGTPTTIQRSNRGLSSYNADQQGSAVVEGSTTSGGGGGGGGGSSSSTQITPWWTRQRQDTTQLPSSNLIGKVRFIPVQRSKSVLVLAPPKFMVDIKHMIEELDLPGMQVMIKAVIVEVALQDNTSLGVMLSSNPGALGDAGVNGATFLNNLQNIEKSAGAAPSTATAYGSGTMLDTNVNIYAMVDLLVQKMNGRVLNQPTLWTKDNEEAIFVKGQKVAFLAGDQTNTTNQSSVSRTYTYDNVGVTLRARPNITPEKSVDITINLNISEIETTLINGQPSRKNLDATTHMIVSDGQTIMMGGILFQNDKNTVNKIPLLSDIPIIGALFTHTATTLTNAELLVFITPYVFDENMRKAIPVKTDHQDIIEQSLEHKEKVAERLDERIQAAWTDPNMFP